MTEAPTHFYAVWVRGVGWLKDHNGREFADTSREVAESVLSLYRPDRGEARVVMVDTDGAMKVLADVFIERERIAHERSLRARLIRWLHGLLGHADSDQPE